VFAIIADYVYKKLNKKYFIQGKKQLNISAKRRFKSS